MMLKIAIDSPVGLIGSWGKTTKLANEVQIAMMEYTSRKPDGRFHDHGGMGGLKLMQQRLKHTSSAFSVASSGQGHFFVHPQPFAQPPAQTPQVAGHTCFTPLELRAHQGYRSVQLALAPLMV